MTDKLYVAGLSWESWMYNGQDQLWGANLFVVTLDDMRHDGVKPATFSMGFLNEDIDNYNIIIDMFRNWPENKTEVFLKFRDNDATIKAIALLLITQPEEPIDVRCKEFQLHHELPKYYRDHDESFEKVWNSLKDEE